MLAARIALVMQLMRIFAPTKSGVYYWSFQLMIVINTLFWISYEIALIFVCLPQDKLWHPEKPGHCINDQGLLFSVSIINVVSDISALILPIAAIWHLQMPVKRKIGASLVFAIGVL